MQHMIIVAHAMRHCHRHIAFARIAGKSWIGVIMSERLLPCPFTGDIPSIKTSLSSSQFIDGKCLEVHQCVFILPEYKIVTSIQTDGEESVEDRAIRFWNTRVYPPEVIEDYFRKQLSVNCKCGTPIIANKKTCPKCGRDWSEG